MKLKSMPPCVNTDFGVGAGVAAGVWAAGAWAAGEPKRLSVVSSGKGRTVGRHSLAILVSLLAPLPMHAADEGYLGSQACAGCHRQIYQSYQGVAMAHSMSPANAATPLAGEAITVSSPKLNRSFQVYREGSDVYQSESEIGAGGETAFKVAFKLEFAVGSGVNGFSYAVRRGDYLFEAPLSYYSRTKKWDLSPGYEFVDSGFNRPLAAA